MSRHTSRHGTGPGSPDTAIVVAVLAVLGAAAVADAGVHLAATLDKTLAPSWNPLVAVIQLARGKRQMVPTEAVTDTGDRGPCGWALAAWHATFALVTRNRHHFLVVLIRSGGFLDALAVEFGRNDSIWAAGGLHMVGRPAPLIDEGESGRQAFLVCLAQRR